MTPVQYFTLQNRMTRLWAETNTVMTLRIMGMTGVVPSRWDENERMVSEKLPAMLRSAEAVQRAVMKGKRVDQIMTAAIAPLSRKVRANRKRLMK